MKTRKHEMAQFYREQVQKIEKEILDSVSQKKVSEEIREEKAPVKKTEAPKAEKKPETVKKEKTVKLTYNY